MSQDTQSTKGSAVNNFPGPTTPASETPRRSGIWRNHPALSAAVIYGVMGLLWITLSDQVVSWIAAHDEARVTAIQTYKGWFWILLTTLIIFALVDVSVRAARAAQDELHATDARYRLMIETTNEGVWVVDDSGRIEYANGTIARMLGRGIADMLGQDCRSFVREGDRRQLDQALGTRTGDAQRFDCELVRSDGESTWAILSASPIADGHRGRPGTLLMLTDITARKQAERALERNLEMQRSLLNELDHRVRNNLSSLSSLIDLSRSATGNVDEFAMMMSGRVQAMAKAHALAARSVSTGLDFGRILAEMIPQVARSRVSIEGPRVPISNGQVVSLAMLLHELASRSVRQGALSSVNGKAVVSWKLEPEPHPNTTLAVTWDESPVREEPLMHDHADSLIAGLVQRDLRGRAASRLEGDHRLHDLWLTLQRETENSEPPPAKSGHA